MIDFVKLNIIVKYLRIATNRNRGISRRGKTYITKQRKLNPKGNRNRIRGWGREANWKKYDKWKTQGEK